MDYFVRELEEDASIVRTAGVKARDDVNDILEQNGWKAIDMIGENKNRENLGKLAKIQYHKRIADSWAKRLSVLQSGDRVLIQMPAFNHSLFLYRVIRKLSGKGVRFYLLIHDLEMFRGVKRDGKKTAKSIRTTLEEQNILKYAHVIIAHNEKMKAALENFDVPAEKIRCLEIFDYLIPGYLSTTEQAEDLNHRLSKNGEVIIAGNLSRQKAAYVYKLPKTVKFNLYGVRYDADKQENIDYKGSFHPDELPEALSGSFGLVWDGTDIDTCAGSYGEYLKINNPHKTSLYLASGIPVAIWKEAALADFIRANQCGILLDSIEAFGEITANLSDEEYEKMKENALKVSEKLRQGYYLCKALKD